MTVNTRDDRFNSLLFMSGVLLYWILCLVFYNLSDLPVDPNDGIAHYHISRYSWVNPSELLNHWGKPMFNILSSPFAQIGYVGMVIFNLTLFSLSAFLVYRLSRNFNFRLPGLSPFILMSSMVFFKMVNAGMTEILMATLTVAALYFFSVKKVIIGAIIASFTIVARPESVVVIPMYALLLAMCSQWKAIPFLSIGFLIFSLWGYWGFNKEILWVIGEDPYPMESPYGQGELTHFLANYDLIFGSFIGFLGMIGVAIFLMDKLPLLRKDALSQALFFSIGSVILVLALHSILWWKGIKGSLGLIRVMATIIPLAAFCSHYALDAILSLRRKKIFITALMLLLVFACKEALQESGLPQKMDSRTNLMAEAAEWYKEQNHPGRVAYLAPFFALKAEVNPNDPEKVILLWSLNKQDPGSSLEPGDIIIWDSQFGPVEGGIPDKAVTENPGLEIVKHLALDTNKLTEWEDPYYIYILRVKNRQQPGS